MEVILAVSVIINIALFFKIWQMTNNVWFIKELLKNQNRERERNDYDRTNNYHLEKIARILEEQHPEAAKKVKEYFNEY